MQSYYPQKSHQSLKFLKHLVGSPHSFSQEQQEARKANYLRFLLAYSPITPIQTQLSLSGVSGRSFHVCPGTGRAEDTLFKQVIFLLFQLTFEARIGSTGYSDIAIDDVFIDPGNCGQYSEPLGLLLIQWTTKEGKRLKIRLGQECRQVWQVGRNAIWQVGMLEGKQSVGQWEIRKQVIQLIHKSLGSLSRDVFEPRTLTGSLCSCFQHVFMPDQ